MDKRIKIAIGVGMAIGVAIVLTRHKVKSQGFSKSKFLAKTFDVPFLDKKYADLQEQTENQETKDGITFRATGDVTPQARKFGKLDACGGCTPPKKCYKGFCQYI